MFFALGQLHLYHISECEIYHWQLKKDFPLQAFRTIWMAYISNSKSFFGLVEKPMDIDKVIFAPDAKNFIQICLSKIYFTFVCHIF